MFWIIYPFFKYYELDIENHNYYCVRQEPRQASPVRFMLKTTLTAVIEEKKKKKKES